jgi:hypothetical protein
MLNLPWRECENSVFKYFLKLALKGKFIHINLIASLLAFLKPFYPTLVIKVFIYYLKYQTYLKKLYY